MRPVGDQTKGVFTFAFVDLAGFTALTEAHGDQSAFEHVDRFCALAERSLVGSATLVKSIGDAVLLAGPDEADVVWSCLALVEACALEPGFPLTRGGVHTGTAVATARDYVGAGVNVAARVTAVAGGGQVVLTASPASLVRARGLRVHELGLVDLRNTSTPQDLYAVDVGGDHRVVDPVCRMTVQRESAAGQLNHEGHDHWFCSLACAGAFASAPSRYT